MLIQSAWYTIKLLLDSKDKCDNQEECGGQRCCNDDKYGTCINLQDLGLDGKKYKCLCKDGYTKANCEESKSKFYYLSI